jgi:hypothetical protein
MPTITELFAFENTHPAHTSRKEQLIVDQLRMSVTLYYRDLIRAASTREGITVDPLLCGRINTRHNA